MALSLVGPRRLLVYGARMRGFLLYGLRMELRVSQQMLLSKTLRFYQPAKSAYSFNWDSNRQDPSIKPDPFLPPHPLFSISKFAN